MATQLSVFIENKPGKLEAVTEILLAAGVSLRGISLASRGDFGVLKLLADKPDEAYVKLTAAGYTVSRRAVAIALIDDRPGSLHGLLTVLAGRSLNVGDCYGVAIERDRTAAIVLDVDGQPGAEQALREAGVRLREDKDIHSL
jgi:hypothetical protein